MRQQAINIESVPLQKFTIPIIPAFKAGLKEKEKEKEKEKDIIIDQDKEKEKEYGNEEELLNAKFREIAEILNIPLQGKVDDQGRRIAIQAGVAIALIHIFETRDLNQITRAFSQAFYLLIHHSNNEVKLLLYSQQPYKGLLRLFNHHNNLIIEDAISAIKGFLIAGANSTPDSQIHPHFDAMQQHQGIERIYELFKNNQNNNIKTRAALGIGYLFRSREIHDPNMSLEIINYLREHIRDIDAWAKDNIQCAIKYISKNN
ncbi:MAG: hypothetical protein EZS28_041276, partial [Streblomastix strix]